MLAGALGRWVHRGKRKGRGRDLVEVGADSLTFFEGDELCRQCWRGSDAAGL